MSASMELKDKLRAVNEDLTVDGKPITGVTISQADFAAASEESVASTSAGPVVGDVKATVPVVANKDSLTAAGASAATAAASLTGQTPAFKAAGADIAASTSLFTAEEITVSDDDREAFLQAIMHGGRYVRDFSLFGGKLVGKFRCRSTRESEAIATWMNNGVRDGKYLSSLNYAVDIRNALLAAQVASLNGCDYVELEGPLNPLSSKGVVTQPGWLQAADAWSDKPEPMVAAIYDELRLFEKKYWTMVMHATDQNFWHPAGSI